jgi:hypothetical protein
VVILVALAWGLVALIGFCGWRTAKFVYGKTGSRPLAAVCFFVGCTIPWADAWIGAPYFYYWQRSHPAYAIYATVPVEGYLRTDNFAGADGIPSPNAPYEYVETRGGRLSINGVPVAGNYIAASVLIAPNDECIESTKEIVLYLRLSGWPMETDEYCLKLVGHDKPISRYALELEEFANRPEMAVPGSPFEWGRINDGFFRIYARQYRIVDRESGELLAEAWDAAYVPWFSYLTGMPLFLQRARRLGPPQTSFQPTKILVPRSPTQENDR